MRKCGKLDFSRSGEQRLIRDAFEIRPGSKRKSLLLYASKCGFVGHGLKVECIIRERTIPVCGIH